MTAASYDPSATNLAAADYEIITDFDTFPHTVAFEQTARKLPAIPSSFIPSTCLSLQVPRGRLQNWRLATVRGEVDAITPNHIIGAVVQIDKGRTSPIQSIDPATRRIKTTTGSVYELLIPEPAFAQAAPDVLTSLGF